MGEICQGCGKRNCMGHRPTMDGNVGPPRYQKPMAEKAEWQDMSTAPLTAREVQVKLDDGRVLVAHYAEGGGEDQPPFKGWFRRVLDTYREVTPVAWRPLPL